MNMTARAIDFDIAELFPEADNDSELVVTIPRSARACYELFADVERLPEWLPIIKSAAVRQRDEHERAIEVAYMATHDRSTVGYRLRYIYSERDLSMSWSTVAGSSIQISGSVQFTAMGGVVNQGRGDGRFRYGERGSSILGHGRVENRRRLIRAHERRVDLAVDRSPAFPTDLERRSHLRSPGCAGPHRRVDN